MKKTTFFVLFLLFFASFSSFAQSIREYNYNANRSTLSTWYNRPGNIVYSTNYSRYHSKTPVVFVHGITGKVSNSYQANISQVKNYHLNAAFVQLNPLGTPEENGKLLKRMIDKITEHFEVATVSIVAHSKGGLDTERALYGRNPYNTSIPSFGYEKVDGVYTLSSPLRGSRVADVGASLSWTGIAFIVMWYTNGYQLTSGSVNSFHNWAKGWRINSTSTFKNAYHPNGASYSRINMIEDNTTRWWAHQSNDACYQHVWYYCYVGNAFHHSAGAYYDAYWQWAGFHSGWRNWHSSNDGFIAEYRAKRSVITNHSGALTPGAGDSNYRVMHDANHTSLWRVGENHFSREVAPYLHSGLYHVYGRNTQNTNENQEENNKIAVDAQNFTNVIMGSNGNAYFSKNGQSSFIIEENNQNVNLIFYSGNSFSSFDLIDENNRNYHFEILDSKEDELTSAYQSVANINNLPKGNYTLQLPVDEFVVMAEYENTSSAFAVNFNFNDANGYEGRPIEVAIENVDNSLDLSNLKLSATVNLLATDSDNPIAVEKMQPEVYQFTQTAKTGHYLLRLPALNQGDVYAIRIEATIDNGKVLLSRNVMHTFYVHQDVVVKNILAKNTVPNQNEFNAEMIGVYPNPATNNFTISSDIEGTAKVYSVTGMFMGEYKMNKKIDVSTWSSGVYLVKIKTDNNLIVKQLIVK